MAFRPSQIAIRLASRPRRRSSTTTQGASGSVACRERADGGLRLGRGRADRYPLAGGEAICLHDHAVPGIGQLAGVRDGVRRVAERPCARHPHAGRIRHLVAERLARLDARRRRRRPEDREPRVGQGIGHASRQRRLRPDDDQLRGLASGRRDDPGRIERIHVGRPTHPWLQRDRVAPRHDNDLIDAGLGGQLPGQRMLAAAASHDEDPGRHDQGHAGSPARLRIGRHARSIV